MRGNIAANRGTLLPNPSVRCFGTVGGDQNKKEESSQPVNEQSLKGKLQQLWKSYGIIAVGTYMSVYVGTLGSVFLALDFDIFNAATFGMDPNYAVHKVIATCY